MNKILLALFLIPSLVFANERSRINKEVPIEKNEELKTSLNAIDRKSQFFLGFFGGASFLGERVDDTAKSGYNLGIKFGRNFYFGEKTLCLSLGYLQNSERTIDMGNKLGSYSVESSFFIIDFSLMNRFSSSFNLGIVGTLLADQDTSLREKNVNQLFGPYVGVGSIIELNKLFQLEINAEQRVDELSRLNLFTNLGVRFIF